jgi:hypothetical protein
MMGLTMAGQMIFFAFFTAARHDVHPEAEEDTSTNLAHTHRPPSTTKQAYGCVYHGDCAEHRAHAGWSLCLRCVGAAAQISLALAGQVVAAGGLGCC